MSFHIVPVAEADVMSLIKSIDRVIINPIIFFLFAVAMVYFLYGVAQYLLSPGNEEVHKKSKSHMIWGVVGLFIMVAVFGIMRIILNTLGENKIQINSNGDFNVTSTALPDKEVKDNSQTGQDFFTPVTPTLEPPLKDISNPTSSSLPKNSSYTTSPFKKKFVENELCWHKEIYTNKSTEYEALNSIKSVARAQLLSDTGLSDSQINKNYPTAFQTQTLYDGSSKLYYVWWDARAPIKGGKDSDCKLVEVLPPSASLQLVSESIKPNPLSVKYLSDDLFYRSVGSGTDSTYVGARSTAINNALIKIAQLKGLDNVSGITSKTILEEKYYPQDVSTGKYDYWVAIQSPK